LKITDEEIKRICSATMYKRGLEYYKEGRVHIRLREESAVSAWIDGSETYNVRIMFQDDKIQDCLCTCPYYQTMGSPCKHIVATLKLRQSELAEGEIFRDDNDRIASMLCNAFEKNATPKKKLHLGLVLYITKDAQRVCKYAAALKIGEDVPELIRGAENFLDCYINGRVFKLSKHQSLELIQYEFEDADRAVLQVLSEAYQNMAVNSPVYTQRLGETTFGPLTMARLLPLLEHIDCTYVIDGIVQPELRVRHENPDILVDVSASGEEINISVWESGLALLPDGSWFFYEGDIFHTTPDWRQWFMPIYRSLIWESRTQIDFKGENAIRFAAGVLPQLRGKQGVITAGLEDMVIDEAPKFSLYFDRYGDGICCVVIAYYGAVSLRLPTAVQPNSKIIIRDIEKESEILSYFSGFTLRNETFYLADEDSLYTFLFHSFPILQELADVHTSDAFLSMRIADPPSIQSSVRLNTQVDLLEFSFQSSLSAAEIIGILQAIRMKSPYYRLPDGKFLNLKERALPGLSLLDSLGFEDRDVQNGTKPLSKFHLLYLSGLVQTGAVTANPEFMQFIRDIRSIRANIPPELDKVLRDYQKDGVHWMKQLTELGFGGILADDMGLGKTLQVIAFVLSEKPSRPALIVTPSALTYNWLNEINRFAPDARAKIIDGLREEREEKLKKLDGYDFIITSYPLLRRDLPVYRALTFSFFFIDEAQHIKNPQTMSAKGVKKIQADHYFALTGTPVENSLTELWSIFDFVMRGYLYSHKEFIEKFEKPVVKDNDQAALTDLQRRIRPFILRRMKEDVLSELPEKIENTVYADFEPEQRKLYEAFMATARSEVDAILQTGDSRMRILTLLMRLRQICCHPRLFDENYTKESGKLLLLEELLSSAIASGHRVLLFSQFTSMLSIIQKRLDKKEITYFYLDGSTPSSQRTEMASRFNAGEKNVFLISLKAGGTGLNLTGADMVIHYDPWWNPAVMDQASDRAYRIGQTKAVQVIKLAARGSIEEQIIRLQEKKRHLADGVIRANSAMISSLSQEEILALFQ